MKFRKNLISAIIVSGSLAAISGQASAHSYYNLTGAGSVASGDSAVGFGVANSINGTDGVSANSNGTNRVANGTNTYTVGDTTANTLIPGTGTAAATATEVSGNLPYMWYSGQHTYGGGATPGVTKREIFTGSAVGDNTGNLWASTVNNGYKTPGGVQLPSSKPSVPVATAWGAASANLPGEWNAYNAKNTGANASTWGTIMADLPANGDHPYIAVAGNSAQTGFGMDYGLIHISCGDNSATNNCASDAPVLTTITFANDKDYASLNGLLDVALYRGADQSQSSDRNAAADITGAAADNIQGSDLGSALWTGHMSSTSDVLSYSFIFNQSEWNATGGTGFYTLVVGAHGGAATSGVAYDVLVTTSPVPVPGAVWMFGSALVGLVGARRRKAMMA